MIDIPSSAIPDSPAGFSAYSAFNAFALAALMPSSYRRSFVALNGSVQLPTHMGLYLLR